MVEIPPTLLLEIDALVHTGVFATREAAVQELLRLGLEVMKARGGPAPARPPQPPGRSDPSGDAPIQVDPARDVNWVP